MTGPPSTALVTQAFPSAKGWSTAAAAVAAAVHNAIQSPAFTGARWLRAIRANRLLNCLVGTGELASGQPGSVEGSEMGC